jgi:hypothetical protein
MYMSLFKFVKSKLMITIGFDGRYVSLMR